MTKIASFRRTLELEAKKAHENKIKRIGKLENVKLLTLNEAETRLGIWNDKPEVEKSDKKILRAEKTFWSDQLRKAHNTRGMTYKRFDGSSEGIVGMDIDHFYISDYHFPFSPFLNLAFASSVLH